MCFDLGGNDDLTFDKMRQISRDRDQRKAAEEANRLARVVAPAPNPFAVFGPRLGVESISDVLSGERGARVSVSDVKAGIDRSIFSRPESSGTPTKPTPNDTDDSKIRRPGSFGGGLI